MEEGRGATWNLMVFFFFRWAVTDDPESIDCFFWGKK